MHRRQLAVLHAGLVLASVLVGWRLAAEWKRVNQLRYGTRSDARAAAAAQLPLAAPESPAISAGEIVAKNLFTPDRTSAIPQAELKKPAPPVPIVIGTMNLGGDYEALMAEGPPAGGGPKAFRRVKNGEQVGGYTVVEIRDDQVVLSYQDQRTTLDIYQSASSVPRPEVPATAAAAPVVETSASPSPPTRPQPATSAPAAPTRGPVNYTDDPNVTFTIEGNRRRYERRTMFGPQVWYEEIPK